MNEAQQKQLIETIETHIARQVYAGLIRISELVTLTTPAGKAVFHNTGCVMINQEDWRAFWRANGIDAP